ncbi:D-alanyl-D-alanine carboxypeptidase family protein [Anaerosalibacter sp. Marseille-P3206]|uniref:D-alanyl-D-alanine carboxypeptidase family protein n=1 Tax=Anaerosalibacter sp. Marseille-P3206 TaxID=1871005 RepID=UPI0013565AD7|nr:D-alanyl-D-alanine carboxypeptidase family protein [Anaerosalibacter sp. Marseille-P3206]
MTKKLTNKITKQITLILIFILLLSSISFASNVGIEGEVRSYLLGDFETGKILEEYNIDKPLEVASITKLMTYLVVMDEVSSGHISLKDAVYIDEEVANTGGSSFNLREGEIFPVETLLESLLIVSANDSAVALAKHAAGNTADFVNMMNEKANELNLKCTNYLNPTGFPEEYGQNMMSTRDIFVLSRYILENYPEILDITSKSCMDIENREFLNENTNPLLGEINGVDGLKTGFTNKAGNCLVSTANIVGGIDEGDLRFISITMGANTMEKRKELSKILLEYGISNYKNERIFSKDEAIDTLYFPKGRKTEVEVYPTLDGYMIVKAGDDIYNDIVYNEEVKLPLRAGDEVGRVILYNDDEILDEYPLEVREDVKKANFIIMIGRYLKQFIIFIGSLFTKR